MKRDRYGNQQQQQQQQQQETPPPPPPKTQQRQQQEHQEAPPPPPPRTQRQQQQQQEQEVPPPPPPRIKPQQRQLQQQQEEIPPPPPPRPRPASSSLGNGGVVAVVNGSTSSLPATYLPTTAATWNTPGMNGGDGNGENGGGSGGGAANVFSSSGVTLPMSTLNTAAPKRAKRELAEFGGWRAEADEILVKAGKGRAGGGGGGGAQTQNGGGASGPEGGGGMMSGQQSRKAGVRGVAAAARSKRRFAVVCSANFNRSMMAHKLLQENNFQVESYGTGREVRLPGKDLSSPEVFPFGTPYRDIYDTLKGKDERFFLQNNLLPLVARNATIKAAPERFQEIEGPDMAGFDVVLCFESRVFYLVVEDLQSRDPETFKPLHVVNMSIKDSFEESAAAADNVLELCRTLDGLFRLEDEAADVLEVFTRKTRRTVLHQVCHV